MQINLTGSIAWDIAGPSNSQQSENELVRSIAQGDKRAMHALFSYHRLRVYRFALRLVADQEAAEDLVSEVFLDVWRHAGRFEGRCRVSTWLLTITRNLAVSMLRRRTMERLDDDVAAAILDHGDDPETAIQTKQQNAILAHCLTKLSAAHREVIDLVYYHGRSINEVAAIIRVPPSTVKTRMFYARKQVAPLLSAFGVHRGPLKAEASACKRQARLARPGTSAIRGCIQ
jgi:RNA polymerase sigma-70 factor (ECF subfamily)